MKISADYYPFGMLMPERSVGSANYRYLFNGMEVDNEVSGNGNSYTTEFRQYDPRLGRWKSLDPLMNQFPWMSPYVAFDNNPVYYTDPLGLASEGGPEKDGAEIGEIGTGDDGNEYIWADNGDGKGPFWAKIQNIEEVTVSTKKTTGTLNSSNGYIRNYTNLTSDEKRLISKGATNATFRPFESGRARVRSDDMPLFVLGGGFGRWGLLEEFIHGVGPEESIFFIGHKATSELRDENNEIERLRLLIKKKFGNNTDRMIEYAEENGGKVYTNFRSHGGSFRPSDEENNTAQFIGTFSADVFYDSKKKTLIFVVSDSKSRRSYFLHILSNVKRNKRGGERVKYGNTYQKYIWTESYLSPFNILPF